MAKKKKFYAVASGLKIGIYDSWPACEKNVKGFSRPRYKSFEKESEAIKYYKNFHGTDPAKFYGETPVKLIKPEQSGESINSALEDNHSVDISISNLCNKLISLGKCSTDEMSDFLEKLALEYRSSPF